MKASSFRAPRWVLVFSLSVIVAMGLTAIWYYLIRKPPLVSSPTKIRPWAEAEFLRLTKPVPSTGSPLHPQFQAHHSGALSPSSKNYKSKVKVDPPTASFVPNYEVIEFDGAEGFSSGSHNGKIRWLAAGPRDFPGDVDTGEPAPLTPFYPDGKPMTQEQAKAIGITQNHLNAWGLQVDTLPGTSLKWFLELHGFENLQWNFHQVFDANTHVPVRMMSSETPENGGLILGSSLSILHDTPLIAVIDLAHGEAQEFDIPLAIGAKVSHADFQLEVVDLIEGDVCVVCTEPSTTTNSVYQQYGVASTSGEPTAFSVIYQVNPPAMANAVSLDALDLRGTEIMNVARTRDQMKISSFKAPSILATKLRVRYRPNQTRLLMKIQSIPGVTARNSAPADLFDVLATKSILQDSFQMRRFIASTTQLKDITGAWPCNNPTSFPMRLNEITARQMSADYLKLDKDREITVDPVAMTIKFEPKRTPTWFDGVRDWVKLRLGIP